MNQFIQPYDLVMLAVLLACLILGVWKGMAWQLAALGSVFVSGFASVAGCASLAPYINIQDDMWNRVLAMFVLYIATSGVIWIAFRLVSKIIDRIQMKDFDRQLGAMFGLAKGAIYCTIITFFAVTLSESLRQVVLKSRSGEYIARAIQKAKPVLPGDVRVLLGKYIDELDQKLHEPPMQTQSTQPLDVLHRTLDANGLTTGLSNGLGGTASANNASASGTNASNGIVNPNSGGNGVSGAGGGTSDTSGASRMEAQK